jgi:hypothetical protein
MPGSYTNSDWPHAMTYAMLGAMHAELDYIAICFYIQAYFMAASAAGFQCMHTRTPVIAGWQTLSDATVLYLLHSTAGAQGSDHTEPATQQDAASSIGRYARALPLTSHPLGPCLLAGYIANGCSTAGILQPGWIGCCECVQSMLVHAS